MRVIPAVDIKDGKCVRLFQGDFTRSTEYSVDPVSVARRFSAMAVSDLHIVDLDGARRGTQQNSDIVSGIAAQTSLAIQLGGGIRGAETVEQWLDAGVTRCVVGSIAVKEPDTINSWIERFGADRIVLALDVNVRASGVPLLAVHGWTQSSQTTLWEALDRCPTSKHLLCTDIGRDGAMTGPNFGLYQEILRRYPGIQLQASGGVRNAEDLRELDRLGCPAAITGRALLDGEITASEVASFQHDA